MQLDIICISAVKRYYTKSDISFPKFSTDTVPHTFPPDNFPDISAHRDYKSVRVAAVICAKQTHGQTCFKPLHY